MLGFRQRYFIYKLKRVQDSGYWVPYNREYQLLGMDEEDVKVGIKPRSLAVDAFLAGLPVFRLLPKQVEKIRQMIIRPKDDYGPNDIFFYDDSTKPEEAWLPYSKIIEYLLKIGSVPKYDESINRYREKLGREIANANTQ